MARVHVDIELRWGDQDAYAHINNAAYARYLEEARVRVFELGSARERTGMEHHFRVDGRSGMKTLVANQQIEFLRVLEYSARPVTVELWIGKLGGSSLEIHYEILDNSVVDGESIDGSEPDRTVVARAITTIVVVDGETLRPVRLTAEGRASIVPWQDEPLVLRRS